MSTLQVKDGAGSTQYMKETGAGSSGDPFVPAVTLDTTLDPVNDGVRAFGVWDKVYKSDGTAYTVKRARATVNSTTATQIVAAVAAKSIFVLGYSLQAQASGATLFNFQDDAGSPVVLSRTWQLDQSGTTGVNGVIKRPQPFGCGVDPTTAGQALMAKFSVATSTVIEVTYIEV